MPILDKLYLSKNIPKLIVKIGCLDIQQKSRRNRFKPTLCFKGRGIFARDNGRERDAGGLFFFLGSGGSIITAKVSSCFGKFTEMMRKQPVFRHLNLRFFNQFDLYLICVVDDLVCNLDNFSESR